MPAMSSTPTGFEIKKMPERTNLRHAVTTIASLRMLDRYKAVCACNNQYSSSKIDHSGVPYHDKAAWQAGVSEKLVDHAGLSHKLVGNDVDEFIDSLPAFIISAIKTAQATKVEPIPACGNHGCQPMEVLPPGAGSCSKTVISGIRNRVQQMARSSQSLKRDSVSFKDPGPYRFFADVETDPGHSIKNWSGARFSSSKFMTATSREGRTNVVEHTVNLLEMGRYLRMHLGFPRPGMPNYPDPPPGLETVPIGFFRAIAILMHARDRIQRDIPSTKVAGATRSVFLHQTSNCLGETDGGPINDPDSDPESESESEAEVDGMSSNKDQSVGETKQRPEEEVGKCPWSGMQVVTRMGAVADITAMLELFIAVAEIWSGKEVTEVPNVCALETDVDAPAMVPVVRHRRTEPADVALQQTDGLSNRPAEPERPAHEPEGRVATPELSTAISALSVATPELPVQPGRQGENGLHSRPDNIPGLNESTAAVPSEELRRWVHEYERSLGRDGRREAEENKNRNKNKSWWSWFFGF